jgi:hypothetical protein
VILSNGLEEIGEGAFYRCRSLIRINISPSAKAIKGYAFYNCSRFTTAILNDGLGVIGEWAFQGCVLVRIYISPSIRAIRNETFYGCSGLTSAILNDGLEEIGWRVFSG